MRRSANILLVISIVMITLGLLLGAYALLGSPPRSEPQPTSTRMGTPPATPPLMPGIPIIIVTAPVPRSTASAPVLPSLLVNSYFDRDLSGWTFENCGTRDWIGTVGHYANGALRHEQTGCGLDVKQSIALVAGTYRVSGWVLGRGRGLTIVVDGKAVASGVAPLDDWTQVTALINLSAGTHEIKYEIDVLAATYDDFTLGPE